MNTTNAMAIISSKKDQKTVNVLSIKSRRNKTTAFKFIAVAISLATFKLLNAIMKSRVGMSRLEPSIFQQDL